jgi:tetratricopeptide (TPR) repeat protein
MSNAAVLRILEAGLGRLLAPLLLGWLALVAAAPSAHACLWDYDTFKEESLGKRELVQVLGGDLRRHSRAFYEAKVAYTRPMIEGGTAPKERYDDLAVALAKLGKLDEALAILDDKERRFPGEYTTLANRGTFLGMKGDLQGSLTIIKQAVARWPDAHFGREIFQVKLLELLLRAAKDPDLVRRENLLGLEMDVVRAGIAGTSYSKAKKRRASAAPSTPVPPKAVEALVGMIRFGEAHELPAAWAALGWALLWQGDTQLAIRAMRRAELLGDPSAGGFGGAMAVILRDLRLAQECCPEPGHPGATSAWAVATKRLDREWAAGQAATAKWQAAEEKKIARKQWKAVFGY